ncbi:BGTF surface domain-containing protein [Haloparvum sp. AD34]
MTTETNYREKARALFLVFVMVVSVFGGTVAFAGSASAAASSITAQSATDVEAGANSTVQTVEFNTTVDSGTTGNVTINTSDVRNAGVVVVDASELSNSSNTTDGQVNSVGLDGSNNVVVEVEDTNASGDSAPAEISVTVQITHDTSGAPAEATGLTYDLTNDDNSALSTVSFDLTDLVATGADAEDVIRDETQTNITGITVDQSGLASDAQSSDVKAYVNVTTLADNGVDLSSLSASSPTADADVTKVGSNSGVTIVEVTLSNANAGGTTTFDLNINSYDASQADATTGLTYDLAASTGTSSNSNYDNSNGNAPGASNTQSTQFAITDEAKTGDKTTSDDSSSPTLVFQGQTVLANDFKADSSVELRRSTDSGSEFIRELTTDGNGEVVVDTESLETGDYFVEGDSNKEYFEVAIQTTSVTAADASVANRGDGATTTFDVTSNRGSNFAYHVSAENLTAAELEEIFADEGATAVDTTGDDTNDSVLITGVSDGDSLAANFTGVDAGDYTLTFDVTDTTAEDTADVSVTALGEGEAAFADDTTVEQRGDVAEITIELTEAAAGGDGTLIIGDADEIGYQANVSFTDSDDDGQVTLEFSSYEAGEDTELVVTSTDDTVKSVEESGSVTDLLDAGDYDLRVSTGDAATTADNPQDLSVLVLEERSTNSVDLWTASTNTVDDLSNIDDVTAAVEDNSLTEADTVAKGDAIVHEFSASGLEGVLAAQDQDTTTAAFKAALDDGNVTVTLNQTEDSTKANRDPKSTAVAAEDVDAVFQSGDTYYVVTKTGAFENVDFVGEEVYNVSIAVTDDKLLDGDDAADQTVVDQFEVAERSASFDTTPVEAEASSESTITGSTTVAPGTELTVRVQSTDDTEPRFVKSQTVTVQADGTFTATFDFSAQSAGDTFEASIRNGVPTTTADGEIVEVTETETATATATETATETETETETATETTTTTTTEATEETTEAPETTTEGETPGFGAILALVAMLAAALLATRRDE